MNTLNHPDFLYKPKLDYIKKFAKKIKKINILEFGVMHGHFGMKTSNGRKFNAKINPFRLTIPFSVN